MDESRMEVTISIIGVFIALASLGVTIAAWIFPDFRHWILPRVGVSLNPLNGLHLPGPHHEHMQPQALSIDCRYCEGTGRMSKGYGIAPCRICGGMGHLRTDRACQPSCRYCRGTGRVSIGYGIAPCRVCGGIGLEPLE